MGTGAHGSSLLHPTSLSDQLVRLTVVDGLGEIRQIDDPLEVNAFRVHLGLLGARVILPVITLINVFTTNYFRSHHGRDGQNRSSI